MRSTERDYGNDATAKQLWLIAGLWFENREKLSSNLRDKYYDKGEAVEGLRGIDKKTASSIISILKNESNEAITNYIHG